MDVSDPVEFGAPTPAPTPFPTSTPTICIEPDLSCPANPPANINARILVEIGDPLALNTPPLDPNELLSTFAAVYNAISGSVCDKCGRRIVDPIRVDFPENFLGTNTMTTRYRYPGGAAGRAGGRNLQQEIQPVDAPQKIILSVTVQQSGTCEVAFDGNDSQNIDIALYQAECGNYYDSQDETCCCLCSQIGQDLKLSRKAFREELQTRLGFRVWTVSELEINETRCLTGEEAPVQDLDFDFELSEALNRQELSIFLEAF